MKVIENNETIQNSEITKKVNPLLLKTFQLKSYSTFLIYV